MASLSVSSITSAVLAAMTALVVSACQSEAPSGTSRAPIRLDGEPGFEVQPYVLPNGQGFRHMTAFVNELRNEIVAFGGLGNGGPSPPTPMNHNVYTLDLSQPPEARDWVLRSTDAVVAMPWFTSTRGFIRLGDRDYLACDDTNTDTVYRFDRNTYAFTEVSSSTLPEETRAGDCCAVGVTITNARDGQENGEERIYILGGRNDVVDPTTSVRYYSVTHDRWERAADLNEGRSHLGCVSSVQNGQPMIYAIGGGNGPAGTALRSMEVYDVARDQWTRQGDFLPAGRTRLAIQNIDDAFLLLVGGDAACAGGGQGNRCPGDHPLTNVDLVDIRADNQLVSGLDHGIPQLELPRHTPATAVRTVSNLYELYAIGGRTLVGSSLAVTTTTEELTFDQRSLRAWVR